MARARRKARQSKTDDSVTETTLGTEIGEATVETPEESSSSDLAAELRVVQVVEAEVVLPDLHKKDLIDQAVERTGLKKRAVKPAIEAALAILAEAVAEGRGLNVEPLGKLRIIRTEEKGGRRIVTAKLRQSVERAAPDGTVDQDGDLDTDDDSDGTPE